MILCINFLLLPRSTYELFNVLQGRKIKSPATYNYSIYVASLIGCWLDRKAEYKREVFPARKTFAAGNGKSDGTASATLSIWPDQSSYPLTNGMVMSPWSRTGDSESDAASIYRRAGRETASPGPAAGKGNAPEDSTDLMQKSESYI